MLHLDAAATHAALPMPRLIAALHADSAAPVAVPVRHVHRLEDPRSPCEASSPTASPVTSLIMPAWANGFYGVKVINVAPGNAGRDLPGLQRLYVLLDAATDVSLALVDEDALTARRTAAASALAADYLARPDAARLLVVDSGRVAALLPAAMAAVRPVAEVRVWSRTAASAGRLAKALTSSGLLATATTDLAASVAWADIVSCATLSTAPLAERAWLRSGTHLDLIGSFTRQMREADGECFRRGRVFVDTDEALTKAGDLLSAMAEGCLTPEGILARLEQLVEGAAGRRRDDEITVFKGVGTALADLAAARLVYEAHRTLESRITNAQEERA